MAAIFDKKLFFYLVSIPDTATLSEREQGKQTDTNEIPFLRFHLLSLLSEGKRWKVSSGIGSFRRDESTMQHKCAGIPSEQPGRIHNCALYHKGCCRMSSHAK